MLKTATKGEEGMKALGRCPAVNSIDGRRAPLKEKVILQTQQSVRGNREFNDKWLNYGIPIKKGRIILM